MKRLMYKIAAGCILLSGILQSGFSQQTDQLRITSAVVGSEPLSGMIAELDRNNTQLQALQHTISAEKAGNRVGLNPGDPQVGINYLKPSPRLADHRLDYSITQELEFPTVYGLRKQVARGQDQVLDQQYLALRNELVGLTLQTWLDWLYYKQKQKVLLLQHQHASQLADAYQRAFEAGTISILERNKARINATNTQKAYDFNEIELEFSWNQLVRLNGGQAFTRLPEEYPDWVLPASFEDWFTEISDRQADLQAMTAQLDVHKRQERLASAMWLPHISFGYMREQDIEVDFRGVTFGLSVPLWQNQNRSKHARLQSLAQESLITDARQQFELEQRNLFQRAHALQKQMTDLRKVLAESTEPVLLRKALELGEITLVEYLVEQSIYYELQEKMLQAELEFYQTQAGMRKWLY